MNKNYFTLLILIFASALGQFINAQDYSGVVNAYLESNKDQLEVTSDDIQDLKIYNQVYNQKNKVTHIYAVQHVNGIEIFNAVASIAIKDNAVFYVGNNMEKNTAARVNGTTAVLNPMQAASKAANILGLGSASFSIESVVSSQEFILSDGGVSLEKVPVQLVYLPVDEELKLAWDLSIHTLDGQHWYSIRVDAITGEILDQMDWIVSCSFEAHGHKATQERTIQNNQTQTTAFGFQTTINESVVFEDEQYIVYAIPVESPIHGGRSVVTEPQDVIASPYGWHDLDGAEGADVTYTRGNNVWATEDQNGNNGNGLAPDGTDDLIFDFDIDLTDEPESYVDASTTNLFYMNNIMHDIFYHYGFDEASGNFQFINYSGDGIANDYVQADAQDGSGTNNATFSITTDGSRPRMSMFLWTPSSIASFTTNSPAELAGDYGFSNSDFGPSFPVDGLTGDVVLVEDTDTSGDANDACDPISNGAELTGNIAVLRAGNCGFTEKVKAAQDAGAIAVIVVNNLPTPITDLSGSDAMITIPSGMIELSAGEALIAASLTETVNVTIASPVPTRKDGSLDNVIIAHEYGHGISGRLTGGADNSGCLGNSEQMGEGWSDWFGLMLTIEPGDLPEDLRGIGTYATGNPVTAQGIRPAAYSTDFAINDLTYADTNDSASISRPHGIGSIWSTVLWDMSWALIEEYGYDTDLYTGTGGNNIALQLVVDGLKLQPCGVGFVEGRDAIIAAVDINDLITDKTAAKCMLWNIFADRGVGYSASQGTAGSRTDQVEAFDLPPNDILACNLSISDTSLVNPFKVYPNPSNGEISIDIIGIQGEGNVSIFDINGRRVFTKDLSLEGTVKIQAQNLEAGIYIMEVKGVSTSQTTKLIIQ